MAIAQFQPKNEKNLLALANAYVKNKQPDEAAQVCEQILRRNPSNGDAQALARSASVIKTMNKGNWEKEGGDFRDKLKSADETSDLEKAASLVSDEETLGRMVDRLREQIKTDPENVNLYREICANLRTLRRYSEALEYVRQARQQPLGKGDTTLEKWEHDFIVADMENKIETLKAKLEENPDDAARYFALSAIADIRSSVKETTSLQNLAVYLYENGDIEHAYTYITTSLADAVFCNARLRTTQISSITPLIDKAYKVQLRKKHRILMFVSLISTLLAIGFVGACYFLLKQMRKLGFSDEDTLEMITDTIKKGGLQ